MQIAKASIKLFVAKFLGAILGFIGLALFARELGPSQLGVYFLFQALLGVIAIPANFGIRGAIQKRISEGNSQGEYLSSAILLKFIALIALSCVIIIFKNHINSYLGSELAVLLVIGIIIQEFGRLSLAVLKGELRVGETALLQMIRQGIWLTAGWIFILRGFRVNSLVYSLILSYGVLMILGWTKSSTSLDTPSFGKVRSLVDYGRYDALGNLSQYFFNWMDVLLIGYFLASSDVGAYETAWRVTIVVTLFSRALATTIFPQISQWDAIETKDRIESTVSAALFPSLMFVIPSFFGTLVLSKQILEVVFGPSYTVAWIVLILLMGQKVIEGFYIILGSALNGVDRPDLAAQATVVATLSNLFLNVALIQSVGIIGAALATSGSFLINAVLHYHYTTKVIDITIPIKRIGWSIISSGVMALFIFSLKLNIIIDNIFYLTAIIVIGAIVYLSMLLLLPSLRTDVFKKVKSI